MTLRAALVALEKELRKAHALLEDAGPFARAYADAGLIAADAIAKIIAAHPAVEGDAVDRAFYAYAEHSDGPIYIDGIRAALDAAWPGMVADAERYRWLRAPENVRAVEDLINVLDYGSYAQLKFDGDELDAAIDKAMEASRG